MAADESHKRGEIRTGRQWAEAMTGWSMIVSTEGSAGSSRTEIAGDGGGVRSRATVKS